MKIVVDTNVLSPHTVPLTIELSKMYGTNGIVYLYNRTGADPFRDKGVADLIQSMARFVQPNDPAAERLCEDTPVLIENKRDFRILQRRAGAHKRTFYTSERWFKPVRIDAPLDSECAGGSGLRVSGFVKLIFPFALLRAWRMLRLMRHGGSAFTYLPIGIHAARDMARMCGLLNGDLRCLFRAPKLGYEAKPGGRIWSLEGNDDRYCLQSMRLWGYFVSPGLCNSRRSSNAQVRILWVGRMLGWKRVDTLIYAVRGLRNVELDLFGSGPEERALRNIAVGVENVQFRGMLPMAEVRKTMREHDVYVLPSDAFEGWGAVVSEALEEGMKVIGTYEAGASATILPETNLFHSGDWRALRRILQEHIADVGIGAWTAEGAAKALVELARDNGAQL